MAAGLPWRKGDNILVYFDDYPSNVYPWMALAERGVEVRLLNIREYGRIRSIDVLGQADEQTKLVALASNHFVTGYRLDLAAIGPALRARNILFCVDGIQPPALFRRSPAISISSPRRAQMAAWPLRRGFVLRAPRRAGSVAPVVFGWHNVRCPEFCGAGAIGLCAGCAPLRSRERQFAGHAGLQASLELLLEIGIDNIAAELLRKRALLIPALQKKGYTVLQSDVPATNASGITTFYKPGEDMAALRQKLLDAGIDTSLRGDRAGQKYIRLSPHFYNTDAELGRALEAV